jgi:hypothetical protein
MILFLQGGISMVYENNTNHSNEKSNTFFAYTTPQEKTKETYYEFLERTTIADTQENYEKFLLGYKEEDM